MPQFLHHLVQPGNSGALHRPSAMGGDGFSLGRCGWLPTLRTTLRPMHAAQICLQLAAGKFWIGSWCPVPTAIGVNGNEARQRERELGKT